MRRRRPRINQGAARIARRDLLKGGALSFIAAGALPACTVDPIDALAPEGEMKEPAPKPDWIRDARIGGMEAYSGMQVHEIRSILDEFAAAHTSVVEIDPNFSMYLTDEEFNAQADLCNTIAMGCHMRGMRAVAYYPTLEVITPEADKGAKTIAQDHPDWLQISINGQPNVFIGGGGRVFWVEPGEESAWMCPTSGYVDYFIDRVQRLARTKLDGVWGDVPLLSDIVGVWPCINASCNGLFKQDTGLDAPTAIDWNDPTFRRWVRWRHKLIWQFEQRVLRGAKAIREDFEVIIETVTMDYTAGTTQGLDGASADDGDIYRCWEVDCVSDGTAMRFGDADDWMSMAVMMRHGRGCSHPRPAWIFSYGKEASDAANVMSLAVVGGNCPYESKIPVMNTTTGQDYRTKMFKWLEEHAELFRAESMARTAVLYSSESRDYIDQAKGAGVYTSQNPKDPLWFSPDDFDSAKQLDYVGDYRGVCKVLIHAYEPYDVVTVPHATAEMLARYQTIVAPSIAAISDDLLLMLRDYVSAGGRLMATGPDPGQLTEDGLDRGRPALFQALNVSPPEAGWGEFTVGNGTFIHTLERAGRSYLQFSLDAVRKRVLGSLNASKRLIDVMRAPDDPGPTALVDVRSIGPDRVLVLFANMHKLGATGVGSYTPENARMRVTLDTGGRSAKEAKFCAPGHEDRVISTAVEAGRVAFDVDVENLALVSLDLA